jgi:hypothetical protein
MKRNKKEQTDTFRYKSPSTGDFIMTNQYLAEIVVKRRAEKEKYNLPYKYWNGDSTWAKEYKKQLVFASRLLKKYSAKAIIKALEIVHWSYSLATQKLKDECAKQQKIIDAEVINESKIEVTDTINFKTTKPKIGGLLGKIKNVRHKEEDN